MQQQTSKELMASAYERVLQIRYHENEIRKLQVQQGKIDMLIAEAQQQEQEELRKEAVQKAREKENIERASMKSINKVIRELPDDKEAAELLTNGETREL